MKTEYFLYIDTNNNPGNFGEEMCAFIFGAYDDYSYSRVENALLKRDQLLSDKDKTTTKQIYDPEGFDDDVLMTDYGEDGYVFCNTDNSGKTKNGIIFKLSRELSQEERTCVKKLAEEFARVASKEGNDFVWLNNNQTLLVTNIFMTKEETISTDLYLSF